MKDLDLKKLENEERDITNVQDKELEVYLSADALSDFLRVVRKHKIPTVAENLNLYHKAIKGDEKARNLLIEKNIRLVVSVAYKYRQRLKSYELIDIVQDGIVGLMTAIDKYDENIGANFSTYALYWIKQTINRGINTYDNTIRLPDYFIIKQRKYYKMCQEYLAKGKELPTDEEWLKILDVSKDTFNDIKNAKIFNTDSLNRTLNSDDDKETEIGDLVKYVEKDYSTLLNTMVDNELLFYLKSTLSPQQYYVLYHTVLSDNKKTLEWTANNLGVTRERVRQIQEKLLTKLKPFFKDGDFVIREKNADFRSKKIEEYRLEPIDANSIYIYLYVRDLLSKEEQTLLKIYLFREEKDYVRVIKSNTNLDSKTIKNVLFQILKHVQIILKNEKTLFEDFKTNLKNEYGTKIFAIDLEMDVKKYKKTPRRTYHNWKDKTYDDFLEILGTTRMAIPSGLEKKIKLFFNKNDERNISLDRLEEILNRKVLGIDDSDQISDDKLFKFFEKNMGAFNEVQRDFLKVYFGQITSKEFYRYHPDKKINYLKMNTLEKLKILYFGYLSYRNYNFNRDKYLAIRDVCFEKMEGYYIGILDTFFGYETGKAVSHLELSQKLGLSLDEAKVKLRIAKAQAGKILADINNTVNLDMRIYKNYLQNNIINFTEPARSVIWNFLVYGKSYEVISKNTGLSKAQVSNTITDALWKIDMYRFEIVKPFIYPVADLKKALEMGNFDKNAKNALKLYLETDDLDKVKNEFNISSSEFNKIYMKLKGYCSVNISNGVNITTEEIIEGINNPSYKNVLEENEIKILSYLFGVKNKYNPEKELLTNKTMAERLQKSDSYVASLKSHALVKLKLAKAGAIRGPLDFIDINSLKETLKDKHLPITDKERYIIESIYGINGKCRSVDSLISELGVKKGSFYRRLYRAIVIIKRYQNNEISGIISYEEDVKPRLKYFTKADQEVLDLYYGDKLPVVEIAKKLDLTFWQCQSLISKLRIYLKDLLNCKTGFDFLYYYDHIDDEDLPLYGNKTFAKEVFDLYFEKRLGANELEKRLKLDENTIRRMVLIVILAMSHKKEGIKKIRNFSLDEVKSYLAKNKDKMSKQIKNRYENYIKRMEDSTFVSYKCPMPYRIAYDLSQNNPNFIHLKDISSNELSKIILDNRKKFSEKYLVQFFDLANIHLRKSMSGKDKKQVIDFLMQLEDRLELDKEKGVSKARVIKK